MKPARAAGLVPAAATVYAMMLSGTAPHREVAAVGVAQVVPAAPPLAFAVPWLTRPYGLLVIPRGVPRERSPCQEALGAKRGGSSDMHVARGV